MIYIINANLSIYRSLFYCGLIISFLLALIISRKNKITIKESVLTISVFMVGGFIGSKLFYSVINRSMDSFQDIFNYRIVNTFAGGRYLFYGGIFGVVIIYHVLKYIMGERIIYIARNFIFIVPLIHGFIRLGFMYVGCYFGVPYKGPFAIMYESSNYAPLDVPLFPIQPVEAFLNIILAIVLFALAYKRYAIYNVYIYLIIYTFQRFILENFRGDKIKSFIGFLSLGQIVSIVIFTATVSVFIIKKYSGNIKYTNI